MDSNIITRIDLPKLIDKDSPVGVELGVCTGKFSLNIIETYNFKQFFMIDIWPERRTGPRAKKWKAKKERWLASGKSKEQYITTHINHYISLIKYSKQCTKTDVIPLRGYFKEFVQWFEDEYFDFIYIDGLAHTGQESGQTIRDWLPKIKSTGIICGHDYNNIVTRVYVDLIAKENNFKVNVTGLNDTYPSWYYTSV
jgi:hypothetical protein